MYVVYNRETGEELGRYETRREAWSNVLLENAQLPYSVFTYRIES